MLQYMFKSFLLASHGSSLLAGATALTHLWAQQYSDGQSKMAVILGKVCLQFALQSVWCS